MIVKTAAQVCPGDVVLGCDRNPNLRGTVTMVCRFPKLVAHKSPAPSNVTPANWRGHAMGEPSPVSQSLRIKSPPSAQLARLAAKAEEECYDEQLSSVTLLFGHVRVSLSPDEPVSVWVPLANAF